MLYGETNIHFAVEIDHGDGLYVTCIASSIDMAMAAVDHEHQAPARELIQGINVVPHRAEQEVWIGFPFGERGAKKATTSEEDPQLAIDLRECMFVS